MLVRRGSKPNGFFLSLMQHTTAKIIVVLLMLSNTSQTVRGDSEDQSLFASGYISAPSSALNGEEPKAKWIWDRGEANPRN
ncbi:MAG: hypothetical protein ACYSTG_07575, partial [Planctomycetota bacterium]